MYTCWYILLCNHSTARDCSIKVLVSCICEEMICGVGNEMFNVQSSFQL